MRARRIVVGGAWVALAAALAATIVLRLRSSSEPPALLEAELSWGSPAADSAETRHLPFEILEAGRELHLVVDPEPEPVSVGNRPARLRARILRPNGTHLVGADFRLFAESRRTLRGSARSWPQGDVAFRPDTVGRHVLQVRRVEPTIRRVRIRVVGPARPPRSSGP